MALCRFTTGSGAPRVGWLEGEEIRDLGGQGLLASIDGILTAPLAAVRAALAGLDRAQLPAHRLVDCALLPPIESQEVWACGVTYERSRDARMHESSQRDVYDRVYDAKRPEIFFKATPARVVGPGAEVAIRGDSTWDVPEPELALVLNSALELVGYTIGNDVSSRSIEGENPLYLPQAKVYGACCALGPTIVPADEVADPLDLAIRLEIARGGATVFQGETSTARLHRSLADLIAYLGRDNPFPAGAVLLTGTGIVPPDDFTLAPGDVVRIAIAGLGTLENPVRRGA
ncbi:MAG TPA: fumarylacetoacetate hydrolase family protein [Thermomicrobiales bacterium]|nr:fumarylacetoacetate hydrolase family protein [Thermomicrobiales bacterium]